MIEFIGYLKKDENNNIMSDLEDKIMDVEVIGDALAQAKKLKEGTPIRLTGELHENNVQYSEMKTPLYVARFDKLILFKRQVEKDND